MTAAYRGQKPNGGQDDVLAPQAKASIYKGCSDWRRQAEGECENFTGYIQMRCNAVVICENSIIYIRIYNHAVFEIGIGFQYPP